MNVSDIIDGVLEREGGPLITEDSADRGGRTRFGISERAHPKAWLLGPPTRAEAVAIYTKEYVAPFAPLVDVEIDERVRVALIDDAVLSGVSTAIRTLQQIVGVPADGILGPVTVAAAAAEDGQWLLIRLVQARAHRLARIVERDHTQAKFIVGWITRTMAHLG